MPEVGEADKVIKPLYNFVLTKISRRLEIEGIQKFV